MDIIIIIMPIEVNSLLCVYLTITNMAIVRKFEVKPDTIPEVKNSKKRAAENL
jgi:hypothetical protein